MLLALPPARLFAIHQSQANSLAASGGNNNATSSWDVAVVVSPSQTPHAPPPPFSFHSSQEYCGAAAVDPMLLLPLHFALTFWVYGIFALYLVHKEEQPQSFQLAAALWLFSVRVRILLHSALEQCLYLAAINV